MDEDEYGYTDDECDKLMDWVADVYEEAGNASPTVDLTQIEVVLTSQGVFLTDSRGKSDL